ncbi:hypothetical protein A2647_05305 [Candidatus Nomurabacteria bacterium RIFCSPHIGHO2_01_FULL_40_24b]|uniref:Transcription regulator TrmB N-terminal domain-containing protein n=1 Tax=Candidatus Nomurabacteria bacterium RIFCSPHIGHO2_01_FULL_40_24b TaxID=1801739 RepID=A0A1F6V6T0_9BACT|nr:MAG: hypothetical protein A2647_05305 [Candidatus Nomurabacteria bacterium RIFCSPHIGHO2_01_FULL_40_24b]
MEITKLEQLGLNKNEAKIYLALLELTEAQAGKLSKKTQINRTTIYDSLERLIEKGLVSYTIQANKKVFHPTKPEKILENLRLQEKIAQEILPELNSILKETIEKEESDIHKGRKGIRSVLFDILNYKEYVAFGSSGNFLEIMQHDFEIFQKRKKELKIKARVILGESDRETESVKKAFSIFRFIPDEFSSPTTTFVYGNSTAIIIWGETPIATVIQSKDVAFSYLNHFNLMWKQAKP